MVYHSIPKQLLYFYQNTMCKERKEHIAKAKANAKLKTKLKLALLYCDHTVDPTLSDACDVLWSEIDDLSEQLLENDSKKS